MLDKDDDDSSMFHTPSPSSPGNVRKRFSSGSNNSNPPLSTIKSGVSDISDISDVWDDEPVLRKQLSRSTLLTHELDHEDGADSQAELGPADDFRSTTHRVDDLDFGDWFQMFQKTAMAVPTGGQGLGVRADGPRDHSRKRLFNFPTPGQKHIDIRNMDEMMIASWDDLRLEEHSERLDVIVQWGDYKERRDGKTDEYIPTRVQAARLIAALSQNGSEKHRRFLTNRKVVNMGVKILKVDDHTANSYGVSILANLTNPQLYNKKPCANFMIECDAIPSLIYILVKDFEFSEDVPETITAVSSSEGNAVEDAGGLSMETEITGGYRTLYLAACALLNAVNHSDVNTNSILSKLDVSQMTRLRNIRGTRKEKALVAVPVTQLLTHLGETGQQKLHVATNGGLDYLLWLQNYIVKEDLHSTHLASHVKNAIVHLFGSGKRTQNNLTVAQEMTVDDLIRLLGTGLHEVVLQVCVAFHVIAANTTTITTPKYLHVTPPKKSAPRTEFTFTIDEGMSGLTFALDPASLPGQTSVQVTSVDKLVHTEWERRCLANVSKVKPGIWLLEVQDETVKGHAGDLDGFCERLEKMKRPTKMKFCAEPPVVAKRRFSLEDVVVNRVKHMRSATGLEGTNGVVSASLALPPDGSGQGTGRTAVSAARKAELCEKGLGSLLHRLKLCLDSLVIGEPVVLLEKIVKEIVSTMYALTSASSKRGGAHAFKNQQTLIVRVSEVGFVDALLQVVNATKINEKIKSVSVKTVLEIVRVHRGSHEVVWDAQHGSGMRILLEVFNGVADQDMGQITLRSETCSLLTELGKDKTNRLIMVSRALWHKDNPVHDHFHKTVREASISILKTVFHALESDIDILRE